MAPVGPEAWLLSDLFLLLKAVVQLHFAWDSFPPLQTTCLLTPNEFSNISSQVF